MLLDFFTEVRAARVPATLKELLDLMEALQQGVVFANVDQFYFLARTCLVKDEKYFDRFDRAFSAYFEGLENIDELLQAMIPEEWLRKEFEKFLTEEEKAKIESLGSLDKLLEEFKKRLEEQKKRHQGGNRWIGTGGTSPFGAYGYNPEGIRIGQEGGRNQSAAKVWDQRSFRNLDEDVELGTRNIKMALRRLRKFARQGAAEQLDIDDTISSTARNGGWLDLKLVPERHNAVKVLLFIDIGGTMDPHVRVCEELFSACKTEFKHLEFYYFHNCLYESVWRDNLRRMSERTSTWDLLHTFGSDYKVIFIGDASMSPYEVSHIGGSVEHWNEEPGALWLQRVCEKFNKVIWLNPHAPDTWRYTQSTQMIKQLIEDKMYPLTVKGLEEGMRYLSK
ncbi:vWA domain-containing protein [Aestuariirhabdus litorea]|uniref:VWA domain-containing protein n=1 Tax=Aestuariirhabdus litorea TaxID=2528527 RepID=A0A3P3VP68_9GAMM|nr:VWA domain-containing protein [Aestuariirhabdus litorea]RRJ84561.1 VWA domain-containing protein [Aestuariirhabdus litorea]RWW97787.1 VWA domain-containing protein [Endozoicomonadaceae bacterium GTF-13]